MTALAAFIRRYAIGFGGSHLGRLRMTCTINRSSARTSLARFYWQDKVLLPVVDQGVAFRQSFVGGLVSACASSLRN
jgi:hypothetical protein